MMRATAERVLRWALAPAGAPPQGAPFGLAGLLAPPPALGDLLAELAAVTAARLALAARLAAGPPVGPGALWLAAAVGVRSDDGLAMALLRELPPPALHWTEASADLLARHGVVQAALSWLAPALAEAMVAASPLSALLLLPARGEQDSVLLFGQSLLADPAARQPVAAALAAPEAGDAVLAWRAGLLGRLAAGGVAQERAFVLDVYETAVAWHGPAWLAGLREAAATLRAPAPAVADWRRALAVGGWWQPLHALRRAGHDAIRQRSYLDFRVYYDGLRLAAMMERLTAQVG